MKLKLSTAKQYKTDLISWFFLPNNFPQFFKTLWYIVCEYESRSITNEEIFKIVKVKASKFIWIFTSKTAKMAPVGGVLFYDKIQIHF